MLNVALLNKVQAHILEEPRRLMMDSWRETGLPGEHVSIGCDIPRKFPSCGTTACICGWACLIANYGKSTSQEQFYDFGPTVLGIPGPNVHGCLPPQTKELFFVNLWPDSLKKQWKKTRSLKGRAEIAGRRIDAYIRKYGPRKTRKKAA